MGIGLTAALALLGATGQGPHVLVHSATAAIAADRAVGDVLAIDGQVTVAGVVRGFVFAVSSTVVLQSSAVVLSPMALHGGTLLVEEGARLPSSVTLAGTELIGELPATTHVERTRAPSRAARRAMARWLPFDRPIPAADQAFDAVAAWTPGADFALQDHLDDPRELVVGGVARLTFTSARVRRATQRRYRDSHDRRVQLTAVELADAPTGDAFWAALAKVPERAVSSSVRTALGDGAHWWFVRNKNGCLMWHRDRWFFALETAGDDVDPLALTDRARIALTESFEQGDRP